MSGTENVLRIFMQKGLVGEIVGYDGQVVKYKRNMIGKPQFSLSTGELDHPVHKTRSMDDVLRFLGFEKKEDA